MGWSSLQINSYLTLPAIPGIPAEWVSKIMHARIQIGEALLMGPDSPPDRYKRPGGITLNIGIANAAEAAHLFDQLAEAWGGADAVGGDFLGFAIRDVN